MCGSVPGINLSRIADLPPELTAQELVAAMADGASVVSVRSVQGRRIQRTISRGIAHLVLRELQTSVRQGRRGRSGSEVRDYYDRSYSVDAEALAESFGARERFNYYRLGSALIAEVEGRHVLRFVTTRLGDILASLSPGDLGEIGCGNGRNLLYLAERFPSVPCMGYELTEAGVTAARRLQDMADLPDTGYGRLYRLGQAGMDNVRGIRFVCAPASKLPIEDRAHDVVFSVAALEQMHPDLDRVFSELRRVTRRYVLLYEPFADCNDWWGRAYLWARNYFRLKFDDLPRHGFEVVRTWRMLPVKPTFAYAFALLKPR
jgi:SAM-dependent methyltransferase